MQKSIQPREAIIFISFLVLFFTQACQETTVKPKPVEIVKEPELLNPKTVDLIRQGLTYSSENLGKLDDSITLVMDSVVQAFYPPENTVRLWSDEKSWLPVADSLYDFIEASEKYGLFPSDYHFKSIRSLMVKLTDSTSMQDAALWARGDLMLSDAFALMIRHLKKGRLDRDSISVNKDTVFTTQNYTVALQDVKKGISLRDVMESFEPTIEGYKALREAIPSFLDSMDRSRFTYVEFPVKDTVLFVKQLQSRLFESSYITFNTRTADSLQLAEAIKKAQVDRKLKVDGKAGRELVGSLNNTGLERFKRIAINLDRYKQQLPAEMPTKYVWVNLPSYQMATYDSGNVTLESKVIIGQYKTRTPVLTSEMYNFITYPQWTVPFSIIIKEMLPQIQKDIAYLTKQNLMVVDKNDSVIDPATINWSKLSKKYFPYNLRQRQGDDNSLGVMKFNFRNKYDVYLHDTNARGMFARNNRALSHGCVRVKEWNKFARYLVQNDTLKYRPDTLTAWLKRQEKHTVTFSQKVPIFIRYITCGVKEGKIVFYDDIYDEDKFLREKYFASK